MEIDKRVMRALKYLAVTLTLTIIVVLGNPVYGFLKNGVTGDVVSSEEVRLPEIISNCYRTDDSSIYVAGKICFLDGNGKGICTAEDYCGEGVGSLRQVECVSDSEYRIKWHGCINGCKNGACVE